MMARTILLHFSLKLCRMIRTILYIIFNSQSDQIPRFNFNFKMTNENFYVQFFPVKLTDFRPIFGLKTYRSLEDEDRNISTRST
jgi:hypothetical protein